MCACLRASGKGVPGFGSSCLGGCSTCVLQCVRDQLVPVAWPVLYQHALARAALMFWQTNLAAAGASARPFVPQCVQYSASAHLCAPTGIGQPNAVLRHALLAAAGAGACPYVCHSAHMRLSGLLSAAKQQGFQQQGCVVAHAVAGEKQGMFCCMWQECFCVGCLQLVEPNHGKVQSRAAPAPGCLAANVLLQFSGVRLFLASGCFKSTIGSEQSWLCSTHGKHGVHRLVWYRAPAAYPCLVRGLVLYCA